MLCGQTAEVRALAPRIREDGSTSSAIGESAPGTLWHPAREKIPRVSGRVLARIAAGLFALAAPVIAYVVVVGALFCADNDSCGVGLLVSVLLELAVLLVLVVWANIAAWRTPEHSDQGSNTRLG